MSDYQGPWSHPPPKPPAEKPRGGGFTRLGVIVVVLLIAGAAIWGLNEAYPGAVTDADGGAVAMNLGCLALVAAGLARFRGATPGVLVRNAAIWLAIAGVLAVGYAYRHEALEASRRVVAGFSPGAAVSEGEGAVTLTADADGEFTVWGKVNGQKVLFAVDTGASQVVLTPEDARRLGIDVDHLSYDHRADTANGVASTAGVRVNSLEVPPVRMLDVAVQVNRTAMGRSLLGMSFLRRLESFEVRGDHMTLRAKR